MSNFGTFSPLTEALVGTAPQVWTASTPDALATILAPGYMDDKIALVNINDIVNINYLDGTSNLFAQCVVVVSGGHVNLLNIYEIVGSITISNTDSVTLHDARITTTSICVCSGASAGYNVSNRAPTTGAIEFDCNPAVSGSMIIWYIIYPQAQ